METKELKHEEIENVNSNQENKDIYVIRKSWWGLIPELILSNIKPLILISFFSYLIITVFRDLSSNQIISYHLIPNIALLWIIVMSIGQVIAVLTTSLEINLTKKTAFYRDLISKKSFNEIVSIKFDNIPLFLNDITIRDKSGKSLIIRMLKNSAEINQLVKKFYTKYMIIYNLT